MPSNPQDSQTIRDRLAPWMSPHPPKGEPLAGPVGTISLGGQNSIVRKGDARFHALLTEIGDLHDKKQADYGLAADPFANVRGSSEWGVPPWVGAMVRANDKLRRLQKFARDGQLINEGVRDSFMDLAVYSLIGLVLFEEGKV